MMSQEAPVSFPPPQRPESSRISLLTAALLILVALMLWKVVGDSARRRELLDPEAIPRAIEPRGDLADDEKSTIKIFQQTSPSVVHVTTSTTQTNPFQEETEVPQGSGTGFVWDREGRIVTNAHVLQNATDARIALGSSVYKAEVVGYDLDHDLAVLKIDAPTEVLRPILIGNSADLQVGQKAFAIGNPFGLDKTLTTGVISGLQREFTSLSGRPISGAIQIDAAINPGNSGGPLLDSAGRLIGINTAIAGKTGQSSGVGFAIPVDTVNRLVPQILKYGRPQRIGLGITMAAERVIQMLIQRRGLPRKGVLIVSFGENSPAQAAGLRACKFDNQGDLIELGDLIIGVNDVNVQSDTDLYRVIDPLNAGDEVLVRAMRGSQELEVKVKLAVLNDRGRP